MADGFARCYNKTLAPRRDLEAKLRAEKKTDEEIQQAVAAAVKAGTLPAPSQGDDVVSRLRQARSHSEPVGDVAARTPTPESVGVSTASQRDAALEGKGLPWMMLPGTPGAHIMIPINPPAKTSTITDQAPDEIAQAALPLPEDLRAGATVYKYDPKTGERIVLRKGTNFARVHAARRGRIHLVLQHGQRRRGAISAKLRAQKKTDKEIQEAVAAATKAGTIKPTPFGTMSYRLYGKKDRIQLLWVLSVPGATPDRLACRTAASATRRSAATDGRG